jgi:hypothetical protein
MSFQNILDTVSVDLQNEIIKMDTFLKSLHPLNFKRTVDKKKINYVCADYGISYAIFPESTRLSYEPSQTFGWYFLCDKETKEWYRKTDYFQQTLAEIEKNNPQSAERIFSGANSCTACKGTPCTAISYTYNGTQNLSCYGRIVLQLRHDDFNDVRNFFNHLKTQLEDK